MLSLRMKVNIPILPILTLKLVDVETSFKSSEKGVKLAIYDRISIWWTFGENRSSRFWVLFAQKFIFRKKEKKTRKLKQRPYSRRKSGSTVVRKFYSTPLDVKYRRRSYVRVEAADWMTERPTGLRRSVDSDWSIFRVAWPILQDSAKAIATIWLWLQHFLGRFRRFACQMSRSKLF